MGDPRDEMPTLPTLRTDPLDPPEEFAGFREGPPLRVRMADGTTPWLVCRHADARAVLADRRFSSDDTHPAFPRLLAVPPVKGALSFLRMDDAEHARMRRMLYGEFTVRRVNALRPDIVALTDRLLDGMIGQGPPADLVADFTLPLPSLVICRLLGVPYADHAFFQRCSVELLNTADPVRAVAAIQLLGDYLGDLVAAKVAAPSDDLLGRLAPRVRAGELTEEELMLVARLLLVAGHETTANMLSLGTVALLRSPKQLAVLRDGPAAAAAVTEELLRYLSVIQFGLARVAREPVRVGEVTIGAGEGVIVSVAAANRDAAHFTGDPDAFDARRAQGHHVAFGYGMHLCVGAALARLEMNVALPRLFERLPRLALAVPPDGVDYRHEQFVYGVGALPVTW
ncbi:cytochrome P450 [Actinocorallia sp. API 0066]|uniref:cytochrome P450 n=1 Tax=Actinocorallia sp. API 0066 TaxID=2896846 RepID=UPI001E5EA1A9|nr:cytochrome P450 [Actinocorallia sp. API 0066]MCD0449887.1 cytochrome P450 [Actinocorallia sp. API 0066]